MNKTVLLRTLFVALAVLLSSFAHAHTGIGETSGLMHGLAHPVGGLDHLCAMLAVGLWAAQMGGRSLWVVPLTFVIMMAVGGVLPVLEINLPFIEPGIALSVLLLGSLIAAAIRIPLWLSGCVTGLFALWHGYAHGAEMPALVSGMDYMLGFVLATALLHAIGISFGLAMQRLPVLNWVEGARERMVRFAGAGIVFCGVYLSAM